MFRDRRVDRRGVGAEEGDSLWRRQATDDVDVVAFERRTNRVDQSEAHSFDRRLHVSLSRSVKIL